MPISAHPDDMYVFYLLSQKIVQNGPFSVQLVPPTNNYFMLIPISYAYNWFSNLFLIKPISTSSIPSALNFYPTLNAKVVPDFLFNFFIKLPQLFSDTLTALFLYKIVNKLTANKGLAEKSAFLWFLNPYLIWISAVWGMWDSMAAMFSLLSVYFLMSKKITLSAVCLILGIASKLYPAMFFLPIVFYYMRTNSVNKSKNFMKFCLVFFSGLALLILPFVGEIISFFDTWFLPTQGVVTSFVYNPVTNPLAFGLTYWSVLLLDRVVNLHLSGSSIFLFSGLLLVISATLTFRKISKMTFHNHESDLIASMLFCVLALFLSFRVVLEQWIIWTLPFLIILCMLGKVKVHFYWGISIIALLYACLNCPFPFFFLPIAPWFGNSLVTMVNFLLSAEAIRIGLLAILGCLFSFLLLLILFDINKRSKIDEEASKQF
jgi:Gpi18-like mannosyltransferase